MNQVQKRESEQWIQNTLTINTKNGAYPVRYWWNGAMALVAGNEGCADSGISEDSLRMDKGRGKIQAEQFVRPELIAKFDSRYTPNFYDLTEWLKYLSAKIKPIREAFVEVGAGCLSGFATDGLRGMLIKGLGMTEEQASLTVVKSYDDSVGYLLDTVDEEGLDALEVITKDREERMKEAFAQRRARLQAEKKAALLEVEVENERAAKEEAIKINLDREQRNIKTLREELKQYFVKLNWNRLVSLLKGKSKFNDKLKPTWCAKVGTVNSYYSSAPYIFEAYLENDEYWHLQYKPGKKEKALSYLHDLYQEDLDNESKACGGWLFR